MNIRNTLKTIISIGVCGALMTASFSVSAAEKRSDRITQLISSMTLEEKISQMIVPSFRKWENAGGEPENVTAINGTIRKLFKKYAFGGIVLFSENCGNTADCAHLVHDLQRANASGGDRTQLLIAADQEGGTVVRLGQGCNFCGNMALAAAGDPEYTERAAEIMGSELASVGINADLAPVVDVNNEPSNPVIGVRSFSDDKDIVSENAVSYIKGLNKNNIISTVKHFPGHGNTGTDSHTGLPRIDATYSELKKIELIPFERAIAEGADMVMTAHIQYPNIEKHTYISKETGEEIYLPATLSKKMITDILRKDMGFEGIVCTDAMNMDAVGKHFDRLDAARLAINAGVDMLLWPVIVQNDEDAAEFEEYIASLVKMAEDGDINIDNVNKSVERIFKVKEKHGLTDRYNVTNIETRASYAAMTVGSAEHHAEEFDITKKSITLLKNDNNTLPIKADGHKTVILTAYGDELMSAQYAVDLLKDSGRIANDTEISVDTYRNKTPEEATALTEGADNVVLITEMYNKNYIDPTTDAGVTFSNVEKIISAVHENNGKVTVVSCYLPYDTAYFQDADAILVAWTMKGMSEDPRVKDEGITAYGPSIPAGVYMAFENGEDISGKLPINIPEINEKHEFSDKALYERGFGLTYDETMLYGDADKDNKVTVRDCALIARMVSQSMADKLPACADHNRDGKINVRDAASAAAFLTGKK